MGVGNSGKDEAGLSRRKLLSITLGGALAQGTVFSHPATASRLYGERREIWKTATEGIGSHPVTDGETIYFGSDSGVVYAIDPGSGTPVWTQALDSPIVRQGTVMGESSLGAVAEDGKVFSIDPRSGEVQWVKSIGGTPLSVSEGGDAAIILSADNSISKIALSDGAVKWQVEEALPDSSESALEAIEAGNSHVAVTAEDQSACFDLSTGHRRWTKDDGVGNWGVNGIPMDDSHIFVPQATGIVTKRDAQSGAAIWQKEISGMNDTAGALHTATGASNGLIFVAGNGRVFALSTGTGDKEWGINAKVPSLTATESELLVVGTVDDHQRTVQSVALETGTLNWELKPTYDCGNDRVFSPPVKANEVVATVSSCSYSGDFIAGYGEATAESGGETNEGDVSTETQDTTASNNGQSFTDGTSSDGSSVNDSNDNGGLSMLKIASSIATIIAAIIGILQYRE